jgi:hypothetical protein
MLLLRYSFAVGKIQSMSPLFPPDYPDNPSAPLRGFGEAFAEEMSRSCIAVVFVEDREKPREADVGVAAALTMLEGLHPRDHDECMMAAEIVGFHAAAMHSLQGAMQPGLSAGEIAKFRSSAAQMVRALSTVRDDLERKQSKPLPRRPVPAPANINAPLPHSSPPNSSAVAPDGPMQAPTSEPANERPDRPAEADELPSELLADMTIRPDGTLGSLSAYAPKTPREAVVPTDLAIMWALATQPKPWRMVNEPGGCRAAAAETVVSMPQPEPDSARPMAMGPPDLPRNTSWGDTLAWFKAPLSHAATLDQEAEEEESFVELELINTGGDPELEAERQALIAAHPEGRPAKMIRYSSGHPRRGPSDQT